MKRLFIAFVIAGLALQIAPATAELSLGAGSPTVATVYALGPCQSQSDLDCVQSIEVRDLSGKYSPMEYQGAPHLDQFVDQNGEAGTSAILDYKSGDLNVELKADLESPEHVILKENGIVTLRGGALRLHVYTEDPLNTFLRIKVRTSWLKPMDVQLKLRDSNFVQQKITGGNLWTFEGSGLRYSDYSLWTDSPEQRNYSQQADREDVLFDIYIHHADMRPGYSYFNPVCSNTGYTVQSNNTNATGEPSWNPVTKSLEFGIAAPHLDINGNPNKGYFKLWATDKFLDCKFPGNNLTKAASIHIEVVDENGVEQVATTSVQNKNGVLQVYAYGFHFSSPTIVLTAVKVTITCVKGKAIKKINGTAPVCPKGYVKKS